MNCLFSSISVGEEAAQYTGASSAGRPARFMMSSKSQRLNLNAFVHGFYPLCERLGCVHFTAGLCKEHRPFP